MDDKMKEVGCFEGVGVEPSFTKIVEASFKFLNRHLAK